MLRSESEWLVGCRDQCRPFSNNVIFEKSFEVQNQNNFNAVDNVGGSLALSVSFVLSAGSMGSGGMFGGWGFKLSAGVKHNQLHAVLLCPWHLSHLLHSVKDKVR